MILNAVSALRAAEQQDARSWPPTSDCSSPPDGAGPAATAPYLVGGYVIWKFAANPELAKQFLVDLALQSREALCAVRVLQPALLPGDRARPALTS